MSKRPVRITGINSLRRVLRKAPDDMKEPLVDVVTISSAEVLAGMLARVPRDTGDLAEVTKIKTRRDGMSAKVGPGAAGKRDQRKAGWRAHFIEFGTVKMAAQPFVYPALREARAGIRQRFKTAVAGALLKIAGKG